MVFLFADSGLNSVHACVRLLWRVVMSAVRLRSATSCHFFCADEREIDGCLSAVLIRDLTNNKVEKKKTGYFPIHERLRTDMLSKIVRALAHTQRVIASH